MLPRTSCVSEKHWAAAWFPCLVSSASAIAAVTVLLEEDLPGQAAEKGAYILDKVGKLRDKYPGILEGVRGKGLLLGMVFPSDEIGYKVASGLFSRNVLTAGTLTNSQTIRIEPALNVPYDIIDEMLVRLEDTFKSIAN